MSINFTRRTFLQTGSAGLGLALAGFGCSGQKGKKTESGEISDTGLPIPEKLFKNASIILEHSCRAKEGESLLVLADDRLLPWAPALVEAAMKMKLVPVVMDIRAFLSTPQYSEGYVLKSLAKAMESSEIVLENLVDTWVPNRPDFGRLYGDYTWQDKALSGERRWMIVQCDGMDKWDISGDDVAKIRKRTLWLKELLLKAKSGRITSPKGTDFTFGLGENAAFSQILGIIPLYGEVAVTPAIETTYGEMVVDGPTQRDVRPSGELDREPMRIVIERGKVKSYKGDPVQIQRLEKFIASGDPPADAIDEVGILTTKFVENDIYYWSDGTHHHDRVHIALGNNVLRDTLVHGPKHMDCEVSEPTISIDGLVIMKEGIFQDESMI